MTTGWRGPALAALVAIAVYAPSLAGGFLYDDIPILVGNRHIQDLGALGTVLRYEPARPLLGLTWALNYAAAGTTPWPYHAVNVLIHAGNAALVASLFAWAAARSGRLGAVAAASGAALRGPHLPDRPRRRRTRRRAHGARGRPRGVCRPRPPLAERAGRRRPGAAQEPAPRRPRLRRVSAKKRKFEPRIYADAACGGARTQEPVTEMFVSA